MIQKTNLRELQAAALDAFPANKRTIQQAADEIRDLRIALGEPVESLRGTSALVLFFPDDESREAFARIVHQANPDLRAREL